MGDTSHLEKMGRELKCPICLSLLNSAVSLTCNHVFCNVCIVKSMKSGSNCPVCKVPYRRREVRAAPHMDSLVSIYKSMEVASGINIFVTQNASSTKLPDEEKQVQDDINCGRQVTGGICQNRPENKDTSKRKKSRTIKSNLETSGVTAVKPSFPTKKRVQVPQYPPLETSTRPAKFEVGSVENTKDEFKNSSVVPKENFVLIEKGKSVLSPFFWLREDDEEKLSQHTDGDQLMDITPPNVPSFSDMKDSDDENPSRLSPTGEVHGKSDLDCLDSEMFEWTQRACSPELLSSPVKMLVSHSEELNGIQERNLEAVSQGANTDEVPCAGNAKYVNAQKENSIDDEVLPNISSPSAKDINNQIGSCKSKKRGSKVRGIAKRNTDQVSRIHVDSKKESDNIVQKRTSDNNGGSLKLEETGKRSKKAGFRSCATGPTGENTSVTVRSETRTINQEQNFFIELPASLGKNYCSDEDLKLEKTGRKFRNIHALYQRGHCLRSKRQKLDSTKINMVEEIFTIQNKTNEDRNPQMSSLSVPMADDNTASDFQEKPGKHAREVKFAVNSKCNRELRNKKKMEVTFNGISKEELVDHGHEGHSNISAKENQPTEKVVRVLGELSPVEKPTLTNAVALCKCETLANTNQCAFCLSSENSEASGEMVHYYNGRPVAADYNGGSKIIHSHRNCTEWAPNVYFQGDTAINLEAELARSRRIKCCCCGLKGAALGCYEKSCRKSFHVPCAKLIPQCRWDTDNFVILCPLHAFCKLPNENSGSEERTRKKCISKGKEHTQPNQIAIKCDISTSKTWNSSGSHDKLILCCSALTVGEREIVSEFERLFGVTLLKKWDSSVTHVVASTDENGACRRTLKILMGVLEGKWILNIEWVKACMKAMKPVDEEDYEIVLDIHGIRDGPRLGRLRLQNKQPKLFDGFRFYLMGDFTPSYKGYLQELVIAAGGTVLHRKPIIEDQGALLSSSSTSTFIIYSLELPDKCNPRKKNMILNRRRSDAEALASSIEVKAVSNSWVLNSIAASKLQSLAE